MRVAAFVLGLLLSTQTFAQSSKDYVAMAERGWSLLVCSNLAEGSGKSLSERGLLLGRSYLEALKSKKVDFDDRFSWGGIQFSVALETFDSIDFALGYAWSSAGLTASKMVGRFKTLAERDSLAKKQFDTSNCNLL